MILNYTRKFIFLQDYFSTNFNSIIKQAKLDCINEISAAPIINVKSFKYVTLDYIDKRDKKKKICLTVYLTYTIL